MICREMVRLPVMLVRWCAAALIFLTATADAAPPPEVLENALRAACVLDPANPAGLRRDFPDARILEARLDGPQGQVLRSRHRLQVPGGEWLLERFFPGGRLRKVTVEWHGLAADGALRPEIAVIANADCSPLEARQLVYGDGAVPDRLRILAPDLKTQVGEQPLNPPVPAAAPSTKEAVRVALVDTGVNYTLPLFAGRLARDSKGGLIGYDYWDMDDRPFDVDASRSPFFPFHHGTAVASIILREAPQAVIIPYRYPRPDMARFKDLIAAADRQGAVIVNLAMGSNRREDWTAFAAAAKARPRMLFVVSAGNDGRDLDRAPVYPAALDLANLISVTSSDAYGRLAQGSNWGAGHVDFMVPGEQIDVIDHRGADGRASGSSFAVPRVTALAARLLARHPTWRAADLKAFLVKRAKVPDGGGAPILRYGWIPDPTDDFEPD